MAPDVLGPFGRPGPVRYDADGRLAAVLAIARDRYRDTAQGEGHPRGAANIASLALGWHEFLAFAEKAGAITPAERAACWSRAWTALCAVGAEQESYASDADPVGIYLSSIRAPIAWGRTHVAGKDGGCPSENPVRWGRADTVVAGGPLWRPQGDLIGWTDGTDLYLESSVAYTLAIRLPRRRSAVLVLAPAEPTCGPADDLIPVSGHP